MCQKKKKNSKSPFEKKKYSFGKKIKSAFKSPKSLKIVKTHFWRKLKKKAFASKLFLIQKLYFSNAISNKLLQEKWSFATIFLGTTYTSSLLLTYK
jgi:hypothetical protein